MKTKVAGLIAAIAVTTAAAAPALRPQDGVVFPASKSKQFLQQCSRTIPLNVKDSWQPEDRQVRKLEQKLPAALEKETRKRGGSTPKDYFRQYAGLIIAGHKMIYVNAFPHDASAAQWHDKVVMVCDGGADFFGVEYDPAKKVFSHFAFNGTP
jgi:hypothetical protein